MMSYGERVTSLGSRSVNNIVSLWSRGRVDKGSVLIVKVRAIKSILRGRIRCARRTTCNDQIYNLSGR